MLDFIEKYPGAVVAVVCPEHATAFWHFKLPASVHVLTSKQYLLRLGKTLDAIDYVLIDNSNELYPLPVFKLRARTLEINRFCVFDVLPTEPFLGLPFIDRSWICGSAPILPVNFTIADYTGKEPCGFKNLYNSFFCGQCGRFRLQ